MVSFIDKVLAYVISFERIFGTDNYVVRICEIMKYDDVMMNRYQWDPSARATFGSLTHNEHTLFLVRKNNNQYLSMTNFEVLNTEIRSLLFSHSYGYDLSLLDFGKLHAV